MQGQGYGQMPVPGYAPMMQGQGYGQMPGQPMYGGPQMAGPGYGQMGGPGYGQMGGPAPQPVPVAGPYGPPMGGPPPYSAPPQGPPYQADNANVGQQIVSKAPTHFQQVDNKIVAHAGVNQAPCHYDGVLTPVFCSRSDCKRWICAKHQKADLVWRTVNHKRCGQPDNSGCPCPALPNWRQTTGAPVCTDETQLIHDLNSPRPPMPGENKCHFCNALTPVTCAKTECKKYICPAHLQHDYKWVEGAPTRSCGFGQHSACWCSKSVDVNLAISTPVCAEHAVDRTKPAAYPKQKLNWAAIICTMIFVFFMIGSVLGSRSSSPGP